MMMVMMLLCWVCWQEWRWRHWRKAGENAEKNVISQQKLMENPEKD